MNTIQNYTLSDSDIIALEEYQLSLSTSPYQTKRRISTWNTIQKLIEKKVLVSITYNDKRSKKHGLTLIELGEIRRIDHCKASFIVIAYLNCETHEIDEINKCCMYTL